MKKQVVKGFIFNRKAIAEERKQKKRKKIVSRCFRAALIVAIVALGVESYKFLGILNIFDNNIVLSSSSPEHTLGVLVLGLDKDGVKKGNAGHTDSITYIAANMKTNKAYALPIYRDTNIPFVCGDGGDNINRIYAQKGIKCLAESTSAFLDLPINKYITITMEGFIDIISALDSVSLIPDETFCSHYGINEDQTYCFEAGVRSEMNADEAMAYTRYRGGGNGEARANRQLGIINAVKDRCFSNGLACYHKVSDQLSHAVKMNFSPSDVLELLPILSDDFALESLKVLRVRNVELSAGNWTAYVNETDKADKTALIRDEIFVE